MPRTAARLARRYLPTAALDVVAGVRHARRTRGTAGSPLPAASGRAAGKQPAATRRPAQPPPHDPVVEALRTGRTLTEALLEQVRALLEDGEVHTAESIAAALRREPATAEAGALTGAVVAVHRGRPALARTLFEAVPHDVRWSYAASDYVRAGIVTDREQTLSEIRRLVTETPGMLDAAGWNDVLGVVYGAGDEELARDVFRVLDELVGDGSGVPKALVVHRDWIRPWVAASASSPDAQPVPAGHVSVALLDYGHPGRSRASANIGDHVQSLASLGHLVRHQDLRFHGPDELVGLVEGLRDRVRPELRRDGVAADVHVITAHRDASMYQEVPPDTWALAFGWYMHAIFKLRYGFPLHRNLRPIFVSFHCNKRELLTPEALEYLRRYGPVGCRDWTTVDLLLSLDVPAFFSGCLTTTVNTVFPDLPERPGAAAPVAYVDVSPATVPPGGVRYKHSRDAIRFRGFTENVHDAITLLDTYRGEHSAIVTSRLHCWLPCRSLGVPVDFRPKSRSDIRFAGLIDTTETEFDAIRDGINGILDRVMTAILSGGTPDEVYELWRELTAEDVAAARRRHTATAPVTTVPAQVTDDVARAVAATVTSRAADAGAPGEVHVALHATAAGRPAVEVLLESLTRHASRGVHVWLLARDPEAYAAADLGALFPELTISVVPTGGLAADLLLAGELLPSVDRLVVLPADAVLADDIARLYDLDLGGHLLAAPDVVGTAGVSGFGVVHGAARRLGPGTATELRRRAYARHVFDFDAFTAGVLVLDLARLRSEKFAAEQLPYVQEFGLTAREVLHLAVGPHRAVVPERWSCVPTRSVVDRPGLLHWADPVKPWDDGYTPEQERWHELREAVSRRAAAARELPLPDDVQSRVTLHPEPLAPAEVLVDRDAAP